MERKFERKVTQDKPLGSFGDRSRPKDFDPATETINEKSKEKDKK